MKFTLKLPRGINMRRNKIVTAVILSSIIIISLNISNRLGDMIYRDNMYRNDKMYTLPKGNYRTKSTSPSGDYTVKTYLCNGGEL